MTEQKGLEILHIDSISPQNRNVSSKDAYDYQKEALSLFSKTFENNEKNSCMLVSPTGSGKSLIACAHAFEWIKRGKKIIIAVPQNSIKDGYDTKDENGNRQKREFACGEKKYEWYGSRVECDYNNSCGSETRKLINYLKNVPCTHINIESRVWICTYSVLESSIEELNSYGHSFEDLFVVIDEAHHVASDPNPAFCNELGKTVEILRRKNVPHMFITATPYRSDGRHIIPPNENERYEVYTREMWQHLASMKFVRGLSTRISVGNVKDILNYELSRSAGEKLLIVLPQVKSKHANRFADQIDSFDDVKKRKYEFESLVSELSYSNGLTFKSVATDESYLENDKELRKAMEKCRKNDINELPDVTLVLGRYLEGTDCPAWSKIISIGITCSPVVLKQLIGRGTRDHKSKDGKMVEFLSIVPEFDGVDEEEKREWVVDAVKSSMVLAFMSWDSLNPGLRFPSPPKSKNKENESTLSVDSTQDQVENNQDVSVTSQSDGNTLGCLDLNHNDLVVNDDYLKSIDPVNILKSVEDIINNKRPENEEQEKALQAIVLVSRLLPIDVSGVDKELDEFETVRLKMLSMAMNVLKDEAKQFAFKISRANVVNRINEIVFMAKSYPTLTARQISSTFGLPHWEINSILEKHGIDRSFDISSLSSKKNMVKKRSSKKNINSIRNNLNKV